MKLIYIFLVALIPTFAFGQNPTLTLIRNVNVVDVRNGKLLPGTNVVVEGKLIRDVSKKQMKLPAGTEVIDGTGKYLMPGLTDGHIHFFQSGGLYTRPDAINLTNVVSYQAEIENGKRAIPDYLSRYLRLGITTISDVGGPMRNFSIRDSLSKNHLSPDVLVTGPLFSMVSNDETTIGSDAPIVKISTIAAADSLLEIMLPLKPDYIKIWYIVTPDLPADKTFPVVKHISDKAHQAGLKLAVHATQLQTATLAVEAGADILVHSVDDGPIPESLIRIMVDRNVSYIPTLTVLGNYIKTFTGKGYQNDHDIAFGNPFFYGSLSDLEWIPSEHIPPHIKTMRENGVPTIIERMDSMMAANLNALSSAKVNIVAGTDAGNIGTMHASSYLNELLAMQRAGMTVPDVLRSATLNGAKAFRTNTGSVEKGKEADLVLLNENPLESLENLTSISHIFNNGVVLKADTLISETPEMTVQRQLNAYNARSIEAFLDTYSEDIELYTFPDKLISKGKDALRTNYDEMFRNLNYLHCKIEKRIVLGNKIIDHERVKFNDQTVQAVAVYEVENGKIVRVTFLE